MFYLQFTSIKYKEKLQIFVHTFVHNNVLGVNPFSYDNDTK